MAFGSLFRFAVSEGLKSARHNAQHKATMEMVESKKEMMNDSTQLKSMKVMFKGHHEELVEMIEHHDTHIEKKLKGITNSTEQLHSMSATQRDYMISVLNSVHHLQSQVEDLKEIVKGLVGG